MKRTALSEKILVLGIDGMDPRLTTKYLAQGLMPHTQAFIDRGACREDLVLLGAQPTVTPPMWTTLATGAYPMTHGITHFSRQHPLRLDKDMYGLDSRLCQAELLWNVFAQSGKKTLVWHWPGSSWPPLIDSENLAIVDGVTPGSVNCMAGCDAEFLLLAGENIPEATYRPKAAEDSNTPCIIEPESAAPEQISGFQENVFSVMTGDPTQVKAEDDTAPNYSLILKPEDGEHEFDHVPIDISYSPLKSATGWLKAPAGSKELTFLFSGGYVRRPALVLANSDGIYDRVAIYRSKQDSEPLAVLEKGVFYDNYLDEYPYAAGQKVIGNRNMRIVELDEAANRLVIWVSGAQQVDNDRFWHPKSLFKDILEHVGYCQPVSQAAGDVTLITQCMEAQWDRVCDFQAKALHYCLNQGGYEIIFSHLHNIDAQEHMHLKYLAPRPGGKLTPEEAELCVRRVYQQTDRYIGQFLHLLDEGWTVLIVSDHGLVAPEHEPLMLGDGIGVSVRLLEELGFTALKKDENGNDTYQIDWSHTRAINSRANHIYINLKGRDPHGIVEPSDKYDVEEELITALYGYKHPQTGRRIVAMALRNKDAVLLGLGGPECGDIIFWNAEGYNFDHCDSLSTTLGCQDSSVSPIFIAAGSGVKVGMRTPLYIREVDVAPTIAVLGGVRIPKECEGAPAYRILTEEF